MSAGVTSAGVMTAGVMTAPAIGPAAAPLLGTPAGWGGVEGPVGFEPTTRGLKVPCSAPELRAREGRLYPTEGPPRSRPYNRGVTRYYSIDDANARIPELRVVLERLRDERDALVTLRDLAVERLGRVQAAAGSRRGGTVDDDTLADLAAGDPELRRIRLRMQGLIDQMQADVTRLDDEDVVLRDIPTGLIDLPALDVGQPIWLCWRLGEDEVAWWHDQDSGYDGRRPLSELG